MHALARTILGDHARLAEIHFSGHSFDERSRTRHDRCDLKRTLQETFKKQGTHEMRTVVLWLRVVQWRSVAIGIYIATIKPLDSSLITLHLSLIGARLAQW